MANSIQHEPDYGTGKKSLSVYLTGVILCVILTLVAFMAVMRPDLPDGPTFVIIFSAAILQLFVQVFCFLRLNGKTEQGRVNLISFMFSILILLVVIIGSLWIMYNLNYNMMS